MFISYIFLQKKESHNFITETTSLYGWFLSIQARKPYKKNPQMFQKCATYKCH